MGDEIVTTTETTETTETSGVNETAAAEQSTEAATKEGQASTETGEKSQDAAAVETDRTEQAFAKRLSAERAKIEQQYSPAFQLIKERAERAGMTVEQYIEAVRKADEEARIQELAENNQIPEEVARKLHELEKFKTQYEQEKRANETQKQFEKRVQDDIARFQKLYPDVKEIPDQVWQEVNDGSTLVDAYTRFENRSLREKIAKLEEAVGVQERNKANAGSSPGSVKGEGAIGSDFISKDTFEANKHDQQWIIRNFDVINKSRSKW